MRRLAILLLAVASIGPVASAQRRELPPAQRASLGPVEVELFGTGEVLRGPYADGELISLSFDDVSQRLVRGPTSWLRPATVVTRGPQLRVFDRPARACGASATRRERIVRSEDLTTTYDDGTTEVTPLPGPAEITLAFEHAGSHWALVWRVLNREHRARYRALERRFFASVRCSTAR